MTRNLFKTYTLESLKKDTTDFGNDQDALVNCNIRYQVVFLRDRLGIIAFEIEEDSLNDKILKKYGFDTKGE